jgi:hypothetical protein
VPLETSYLSLVATNTIYAFVRGFLNDLERFRASFVAFTAGAVKRASLGAAQARV